MTATTKLVLREVQTISGEDIGHTIRYFDWDADHETATVVTAELRQISHNSSETTLIYGAGAVREHTFQSGEPVSFNPPYDYSDVVELRQRFLDFHDISGDAL